VKILCAVGEITLFEKFVQNNLLHQTYFSSRNRRYFKLFSAYDKFLCTDSISFIYEFGISNLIVGF
jgi:hypothetical protein